MGDVGNSWWPVLLVVPPFQKSSITPDPGPANYSRHGVLWRFTEDGSPFTPDHSPPDYTSSDVFHNLRRTLLRLPHQDSSRERLRQSLHTPRACPPAQRVRIPAEPPAGT